MSVTEADFDPSAGALIAAPYSVEAYRFAIA